jgi:phosphonopyruvate decarboxylase
MFNFCDKLIENEQNLCSPGASVIDPAFIYHEFLRRGTEFFTGVPDSLLKSFCAYIIDHTHKNRHIIAVNEGAAVALASGYHLVTGKTALVYMQNSGIGNAVNPLLSLADPEVYRIPMILVIGWRGEPGVHDEPQHVKQGKVTGALLEAMGIPHVVLASTGDEAKKQIDGCYRYIAGTGAPYAFVVKKDTFTPYTAKSTAEAAVPEPALTREDAIDEIIRASGGEEFFFSTTGMASRELYELREKHGLSRRRDFLTLGSMGHASSLALAAALQKPELYITCLDGDGAALMHLGAMAAIGERKPPNLRHIILNNGAHDSVGGQPTIAPAVDFPAIAKACGYTRVGTARSREEIRAALAGRRGPEFLEVLVRKGARKDLGRPGASPEENKAALMAALGSGAPTREDGR